VPLPPVLVEILADEPRPDLTQALLAACSHAVQGTDCVEAAQDGAQEEATAVAIVTWEEPGRVRIQVGLRPKRQWRVRYLVFEEADEELERWRAAGYATGTLAGQISAEQRARRQEPAPAAAEPGSKPQPPPAPPAKPPTPKTPRKVPAQVETDDWGLWVDLGALVGPGLKPVIQLEPAPRRFGLVGRAAYAPIARWPFAHLAVVYAQTWEQLRGVGARWASVALGAGYALFGPDCTVCAELRASLLVQGVWVEAVNTALDVEDSGHRWTAGAGPGADFSWVGIGDFGPFASFEVAALASETRVELFGTEHSTLPRWEYSAALGLRWRPR
jgi:hypothetical protein